MSWIDAAVAGVFLGGVYALLGVGLLLVRRVLGAVDLPHGEVAVLGALVTWSIGDVAGLTPLANFLLVVPVLASLGYALHAGLLEHALHRAGEDGPIVILLAVMLSLRAATIGLYSSPPRSLDPSFLGRRVTGSLDLPSLTWLAVVVVAGGVALVFGLRGFLGRAALGRRLLLTGSDSVAAELTGVRPASARATALAIGFTLAGVAGVAHAMARGVGPAHGTTLLVFGFEALVIGGLAKRRGVLLGAMALGVVQALAAEVAPTWGELAGHLLFFAVLAVRPAGLSGLRMAT